MIKEAQIERDLISQLIDLKYTFRPDIKDRTKLELNFRQKFEELNNVKLSNREFERLLEEITDPDVFKTSELLRVKNYFSRDDGSSLHYTLVNVEDWCKNDFEVINQLRINTKNSHHRYDVILLINGLPMVQIELKTLQVTPRKAMQQIVDYKIDPGNGYTNSLLCFMQLFIVSNKTSTYYFSNNNNEHFAFNADEQFIPVYQFADESNKKISHLDDFTEKFLAKCSLAQMISRYMVLVAVEQKILIMRPYQIYAVKAIMDCIQENRGNGYIWHTTGSGKTLTSFKASTLLKENPNIEKCLFVVDRKDLDRQTREEFNRFQKDCVEKNTNTGALVDRLLSTDYSDKVIVTTIQKLGLALDPANSQNYKEKLQPLSEKRVAFIFDECHRSQFGENHKAIKDFFPNSQLFGFTGTPIFEENATYKTIDGQEASYKTTKDVFQKELHEYTITNAIEDKNVLRFNVDYFKPDAEVTVGSGAHKEAVVKTILNKHLAATSNKRFNAVFATSSINDAIEYFRIFQRLQNEKLESEEDYQKLRITSVFSPPAEGNKDILQIQEDLPQEKADNSVEPGKKKEALNEIIEHYNNTYNTNHSIKDFDKYYKDVQQRIKDQKYPNKDYPVDMKIDIVIVVDMLLTGFDSKYLNTLYVDKNLKYHGLIQAFSRTNRILNDTKPTGVIMDFRQQEDAVNQAIALYSGGTVDNPKEIWLVEPAPKMIVKYKEAVERLNQFMESQGLEPEPSEVNNLKGDIARAEFINKFKEIQKYKTQLDQYTDLEEEQRQEIEEQIPEDTFRSFKGVYIDTAKRLRDQQRKGGEDVPEEVQQLDFEFVLFSSAIIDYDYIMSLLAKYTQGKASKQKMTQEQLVSLLCSSSNLMDERDDIIEYINTLKVGNGLSEEEIRKGYQQFKIEKSEKEIEQIAQKNGLENKRLKAFVEEVLSRMIFDGQRLSDLLEPLELGWKNRTKKETELMEDLAPLLIKRAGGRDISGLAAYE